MAALRCTSHMSNLGGGRGILKLDESCISNPKSEIADWTETRRSFRVQCAISDFGFEMQDSSNFKIPRPRSQITEITREQ